MIDKPKDILVAEDNPITRKSLSALLKKAGHGVRIAEDGAQAFALVQERPPQIVVTDWNMPRMSGLELCRSIRKLYPPQELYLLVATARDSREDTLDAMQAGADDFLTKPVDSTELLARVCQAEITQTRFRNQAALAEKDPLTGLNNRRVFWNITERGLVRAKRYDLPLSAAVLDIDFFKNTNDQYGHATGDKVLCHVARILQESLRSRDCLARLGGDEFAILLPDTPLEEASTLADRIRLRIAECTIRALGNESELTITAGVTSCRAGALTVEQLIDHADQALLSAKRAGRNQVATFEELHRAVNKEHDALSLFDNLVAADIMTVPLLCLHQDEPLHYAVAMFLELQIDSAPVVNDRDELVGMVAEFDLLNYAMQDAHRRTPIKDFATAPMISFDENSSVHDICRAFQRNNLQRAVIVRDAMPIGLVTQSDIFRLFGSRSRGGET